MKAKYWMTLVIVLVIASPLLAQKQGERKIILITFDGMRWKDVFRGADSSKLFPKIKGTKDSAWRAQRLWAATPVERRKKLMPFLWETIVTKGQIYGNRDLGSYVNVTNNFWFSYPGYNEIFTGYGDSIINSNDYGPNPNVTLQEFVNKQPGYQGKVAAFASWAAFNRIMNEERCGFPVNAGYEAVVKNANAAEQALSDVQFMFPKLFGRNERPDGITFMLAKEYMKKNHPKFLQISFIETDAYGHRDSYEYYLESANANDSMIRNIWNYVQSDPFYKDQTTILITCDHGRGEGEQWKSHSRRIPEADQIWMAVMGPGIKPLGETKNVQVYQNQFAQTMASLLGLQYVSQKPIGPVVRTVLDK